MNHYETLGVQSNATAEEIKQAYRKLVMQHHPDKGGDAETFKQITNAYETLSDADKKQQYDYQHSGHGGAHVFMNFGGGFDPFEDIIMQATRSFRQQQPQKNPDAVAEINITLQQAFHGVEYVVDLGYTKETLNIQPGVRDGTRYRIREKAPNKLKHLAPGDLIVKVNVIGMTNVSRDNNDLYARIEINAIQAMVGVDMEFQHLSGKMIKIKVPPGTQPGSKLRLKGFGMPDPVNNITGDMYVVAQIQIPRVTDPNHIQQLNNIYSEVTDQ